MTRFRIFALAWLAGLAPSMSFAQTPPEQFDSPDRAAQALIAAAAKNDTAQLAVILGSPAKGILTSGSAAQDASERLDFVRLASAHHHTVRSSMNDKMAVLLVGSEDWPFPVPMVRTGDKWHFDPQLGAVEMRARRIGSDELDAIAICAGYVTAQQEYAAMQAARNNGFATYAESILSPPGSRNGLYQPDGFRKLVPAAFAKADLNAPAAERKPYHGYYFKVLTQQGPKAPGGARNYIAHGAMIGGFALIAWPADYGVTGLRTFIVSDGGQIYQKDLGPNTDTVAPAITSYNPDGSWSLAGD